MGATKTEHFSDKQNEIAILAKALGHPARIAIIDYLLTVDTCICGDIVIAFGSSNSFATFERTEKCETYKGQH